MRRLRLFLVLIALQFGCGGEEAREREREARRAQEAAAAAEQQRQQAATADAVWASVAALGNAAKSDEVVSACELGLVAKVLAVNSEVAEKCGQAYLEEARRALKKGELDEAKTHLQSLQATGTKSADADRVEEEYLLLVSKAKEREAEERAREEFLAAVGERKAYASQLRDHFLDQGMDIKVSVSGKHNERLKLTFVLFNDVWMHNFKKGSLIDEIRGKGFRRVDLSDGYEGLLFYLWLTIRSRSDPPKADEPKIITEGESNASELIVVDHGPDFRVCLRRYVSCHSDKSSLGLGMSLSSRHS